MLLTFLPAVKDGVFSLMEEGRGEGRGCEPGSQECQLQPGVWGSVPWVLHWGTAVLSAWPRWAGFCFCFAAPTACRISQFPVQRLNPGRGTESLAC